MICDQRTDVVVIELFNIFLGTPFLIVPDLTNINAISFIELIEN